MTLKDKIRSELEKLYGPYSTNLEKLYEDKIIYEIEFNDIIKRKEWVTYNQVIYELKRDINYKLKLNEVLYRITDNENPREVCISILEQISSENPELTRLYEKIINF